MWYSLHRRDSDIDLGAISDTLRATYQVLLEVGVADARVCLYRRAQTAVFVSFYEGPPDPFLESGSQWDIDLLEDLYTRNGLSRVSFDCSLGGAENELVVLATSQFHPLDEMMIETVAETLTMAFTKGPQRKEVPDPAQFR